MRKIILFAVMLFSLPLVLGVSCVYEDAPFIKSMKAPAVLCETDASGCYTLLANPDDADEVWGRLPVPEDVMGVGRVDYFPVINGVSMVSYHRGGLFDGVPVTVIVTCDDERTSFNVTPRYADYDKITDWFLWTKDNASYVIFGILFILLFVLVGAFIYNNTVR